MSVAPFVSADELVVYERTFNDSGQVTRQLLPGAAQQTYEREYTKGGRVSRLRKLTPGMSPVVSDFDEAGHTKLITDEAGKSVFGYDADGRLSSFERDGYGSARFKWDASGRHTEVDCGQGLVVRYRYDFLGRISRVETPAGSIEYEYHSGGAVGVRKLPGGVWSRFESHPDGSLRQITHADESGRVLARFDYEYREDGSLAKCAEIGKVFEYGYDPHGQLLEVRVNGAIAERCAYGKAGERLSEKAEGDWMGRLTRLNGMPCLHDAAGNLDSIGRDIKFTHAPDGKLTQVNRDGREVRYVYDGAGSLIGRQSRGGITRFLPNPLSPSQSLLQTDADGRVTLFVWLDDTLLATVSDSRARFFLDDRLGTARMVVNKGEVIGACEYSAFGKPKNVGGDGLTPGLAGMLWDAEAGVYLAGERVYDPVLGRFIEPDPEVRLPMGASEDFSPYLYCGNDPLNYKDLTGRARTRVNDANWWRLFMDQIQWRKVVDAQNAVTWYDRSATNAIQRGQGWRASAFDMAAGYVLAWQPSAQAVNARQQRASSAFSLASGFMPPVAITMGLYQLPQYAVQKNYTDFALTTLGLGLGRASDMISKNAQRIRYFPYGPGFELPENAMRARGLDRIARSIDSLDAGLSLGKVILDHRTDFGRLFGDSGSRKFPLSGTGFSDSGSAIRPYYLASDYELLRLAKQNADLRPLIISHYLPGSQLDRFSPTNVGGVSLAGAGKALAALGDLRGISFDENGRWLLLGSDAGSTELPPLRLDDVAVVFGMVYGTGLAPSVTIDPMPGNPRGPKMRIRHDPDFGQDSDARSFREGTAGTYVGWVLFEADLWMKRYNVGRINTGEKSPPLLKTSVPGWPSPFAGSVGRSVGQWERFWIVPSNVRENGTRDGRTALLDLNLKVNTQSMLLKNGRMVPSGKLSSKGASDFSAWFTTNYDAIADEAISTPPAGLGLDKPVKVLHELRSIALIVALAEKLRDEGVPLPDWLLSHQPLRVRPALETFSVSNTETVVNGRSRETRSVFGGVSLDVAGGMTKQVLAPAMEANMAKLVADAATTETLQPSSVGEGATKLSAVPVFGADSRALGGNKLAHTDIAVPLPGGGTLALTRQHSSFHVPDDDFGPAWTLNLPRMVTESVPVRGSGGKTILQQRTNITSPLGTWNARNVSIFKGRSGRFPFETREWLAPDGTRWEFDPIGLAILQSAPPHSLVFLRDKSGHIHRIEGRAGKVTIAAVDIERDAKNRIAAATSDDGKAKQRVTFSYDANGQLAVVATAASKLTYAYDARRVASVSQDGVQIAAWKFDPQGRVLEQHGNGESKNTKFEQGRSGTRVTSSEGHSRAVVDFDSALRPVAMTEPDGTTATTEYQSEGKVRATVSRPGEPDIIEEINGGRRTLQIPGSSPVTILRDAKARLIEISNGDAVVLTEKQNPDGTTAELQTPDHTVRPEYREDGSLKRVLVTPPGKGTTFREALEISYDEAGRISKVSDTTGLDTQFFHDANDRLNAVKLGNVASMQVRRSNDGDVESVKTSWGFDGSFERDGSGRQSFTAKLGGKSGRADFDAQGNLVSVQPLIGAPVKIARQAELTEINVQDGPQIRILDDDGGLKSVVQSGSFRLDIERDTHGTVSRIVRRPAP